VQESVTRLPDDAIARLRAAAAQPALPPDRYVLGTPIGRGGMGAVYSAYDRRLERDVAIKVSHAASSGGGLEARLRQESRVLARLEHPGIVPVHDAGELDDGRWFYVMKRVHGETLADHLPRLAGEAAILGVFERLAETVAFAHAAGVVHRDLKPSNVMVGRFGEVLVLDWGVAKVIAGVEPDGVRASAEPRAEAGDTADGTRLGTPGFMAPEQQRGEASLAGPAADVYALGAVLRFMLAGAPPPRRLRAIVARCLADAPEDRYPDAGALVEDLGRYRAGQAVHAYRESPIERVWRVLEPYRAFILLIVAYLVMRALFAWMQR
jgi:eukaryotic-like serine/threonine-protein kinase